jgi:hypothetical protein
MPGRKLIAALFYELSEEEKGDFEIPESVGTADFPDELITLIKNYKPVELKSLAENLATTQRRLDELANELRDDRTWKKDFRDGLDKQSQQIEKLLEGLREERDPRQEEDKSLRTRLESMSGVFGGLRVIAVVVTLILGALLGGLGSYFIPPILFQRCLITEGALHQSPTTCRAPCRLARRSRDDVAV